MSKKKIASIVAVVGGIAACAPQLVPAIVPAQHQPAAYSILTALAALLGLFAKQPHKA